MKQRPAEVARDGHSRKEVMQDDTQNYPAH